MAACTVPLVLFDFACTSGAALAERAPISKNAAPIATSSLPDFIGKPPGNHRRALRAIEPQRWVTPPDRAQQRSGSGSLRVALAWAGTSCARPLPARTRFRWERPPQRATRATHQAGHHVLAGGRTHML